MAVLRVFGSLRALVGADRFEVQAATIGAALEQGFIRFGPAFRQALLGPDGQPAEGVIVLVDGRNVRFAEGLETPLGPDDEAAIFPPSAGG